MSLIIIPTLSIYQAITIKDMRTPGALESRQAFNHAVDIRTKYNGTIILPKLVDDKIRKNLNPSQIIAFYAMVTHDNTCSGEAGYNADNCIARTGKMNSFKAKTIIISQDGTIPDVSLVKDNKKVKVLSPIDFIIGCGIANKIKEGDSDAKMSDILNWVFFINTDWMNIVKDELKKISK